MKTKKCGICLKIKPSKHYWYHPETLDKLGSWCKACYRTRRKKNRKKFPNKTKNESLLYTYGITLERYNEMLFEQGSKCAICLEPESQKNNKKPVMLSVDHCHTTNVVRGLLCKKCNFSLGNFKDDIDKLCRAVIYLNKYNKQGAA